MTDLEKECIKDDELRNLILDYFGKLNKINKDKIKDFIEKNDEKLKSIVETRNWKVWLLGIKKKYKKLKEDEDKDDGKGTGLPNVNNDDSLSDDPGLVEEEYKKNKQREKERRKKEKKKIEEKLKPYNAKLIEYKEIDDYIKKGQNVLILENGDNIIIDDDNLFKLREDEDKFIEKQDDGRIILVDSLNPGLEELRNIKNDDEDDDEDSSSDEEIELIQEDSKTVSVNRKAFVDWVNKDFYKYLETKNPDSPLRVYQLLIKEYLSLETPYRGVLVYHGLGTGKTASAVSLAEGLSTELKINTILPASLETEFIKEIQNWGKEELNKDSLWRYYSDQEISDLEMINMIEEKYNLSLNNRKKIMKNTQLFLKRKLLNEDKDTSKIVIKKMEKEISKLSGVWLPDTDGVHIDDESLSEYQKVYINEQMKYLISKKYNFIHYNPFPKVKNSSIQEFVEDDDELEDYDLLLDETDKKVLNTQNKKIVDKLEKKLKWNRKKHFINSPFYKEVVIIDEVHNFVRQILNLNSDDLSKKREAERSSIFYEWIINAKDIKLIFLSGTPVINKPCEIAILYNMLKGLIKIYTFTVITNKSVEEITDKLNNFYYKDISPIELFHVSQKDGKITVSYIQETSNFKSLRDEETEIVYSVKSNDTTFEKFISHIYDGLHSLFDKNDILPKQATFNNLSKKEIGNIQIGDIVVYDKDLNIPFNRQQKLFDIYENDKLIDATKHENFMSYFFENGDIVPEKKKILLKRMLMGLTSYYPIDRSSIVYMPQVIKPHIDSEFKNYEITKNLNIVTTTMSQIQFEGYLKGWQWQKKIEEFQSRKGIWEEEIHHYNIRTRQACNVVFNDEENFRMMKKGKTKDKETNSRINKEIERLKNAEYDKILQNKLFNINNDLEKYSPKFKAIYENMQRFMKNKTPTGKILFYSDFRSDAGSESFELMLKCNGYSKLDTENLPQSKGLRYTFITGSESPDERKKGKDYFNDVKNKYGEYCQVIIISSAGAEGISLTCVRQVHILEPYWNYVRIDQVLGRAIRMKSHTGNDLKNPWLPKEKQNVEQYLYLSKIPEGFNAEEVYKSLSKLDTWNIPDNWKLENIKTELSKEDNVDYKDLIEDIIRVNIDGSSADVSLFQIMEEKYKFSLQINDIIKQSSLDCIKHTIDDPELNDKCIRFSEKLTGEISYFPGIGAKVLEEVDIIQLKAKYIYEVEKNIYVISAMSNESNHNLFLYYEYNSDGKKKEDIDIRYLRENGKRLCDVYVDTKMILNYVDSKHPYNDRLSKEFSVFQELYNLDTEIIEKYIEKDKFPPLEKLFNKHYLEGYKLKYNINDTFYYMGTDSILPDKCIQKIYPYSIYENDRYSVFTEKPIIILGDKLYVKD